MHTKCSMKRQPQMEAIAMGSALLIIAGAMFGIPLVMLILIAVLPGDIPRFILSAGGWSMAFGVILAGIGAVMTVAEGNSGG